MAIEDMGGPVLGFCGGRIDHVDNTQTLALGPTPEQEKFAECLVDGDCQAPLGANTLGLIYVNPEGPMGKPDPQGAADTIRDVFGRMDMDDRENVALIGGGHTFGKTHGASTEGPGPKPFECPMNPWPGNFGTGVGNDVVTSGFEGAWTGNPTSWDNSYFKNLINYEWESWVGPGGHYQWRVKGGKGPKASAAHGDGSQNIMMLTTDIGLATDPEYRKYVEEFAHDEKAFSGAFAAVWYKLVNRDMGPVTRCVGPLPLNPFSSPFPTRQPSLPTLMLLQKTFPALKEVNSFVWPFRAPTLIGARTTSEDATVLGFVSLPGKIGKRIPD
jgi:catalase-peroxidase